MDRHRPGLWAALVAAYRDDFRRRGISREVVIAHSDNTGHVDDDYQEVLTAPRLPGIANIANGGDSGIDPGAYIDALDSAAHAL